MSKSLGNVISPKDVRRIHGVDALRFVIPVFKDYIWFILIIYIYIWFLDGG